MSHVNRLNKDQKVLEQCHFYGLVTDKQHGHIQAAMNDPRADVTMKRDQVGASTTVIWTITYKATFDAEE